MKKKATIGLLFIATCITGASETIDNIFKGIPTHLFPHLSESRKLDILDYAKCKIFNQNIVNISIIRYYIRYNKNKLENEKSTYNGEEIKMPPKEFDLLYFLANNKNKVFTREQLLCEVWGYDYPGDSRTVDVHIKRLREKIVGGESWELETVWGIGYKWQ